LNADGDVAPSTPPSLRYEPQAGQAGHPELVNSDDIPGLRVRHITGFPCGWYYFFHQDRRRRRDSSPTQDLNAALDTLDE
jgi:hypothetical protein